MMLKILNTYKEELGVIPLLFQEQENLGSLDETNDSRAFLGSILYKRQAQKATGYSLRLN